MSESNEPTLPTNSPSPRSSARSSIPVKRTLRSRSVDPAISPSSDVAPAWHVSAQEQARVSQAELATAISTLKAELANTQATQTEMAITQSEDTRLLKVQMSSL